MAPYTVSHDPTVIPDECNVEFCQMCSDDPNVCQECEDGFVSDQSTCMRGGGVSNEITGR